MIGSRSARSDAPRSLLVACADLLIASTTMSSVRRDAHAARKTARTRVALDFGFNYNFVVMVRRYLGCTHDQREHASRDRVFQSYGVSRRALNAPI
jgi:hypothetical protein